MADQITNTAASVEIITFESSEPPTDPSGLPSAPGTSSVLVALPVPEDSPATSFIQSTCRFIIYVDCFVLVAISELLGQWFNVRLVVALFIPTIFYGGEQFPYPDTAFAFFVNWLGFVPSVSRFEFRIK
jgi:hypothetical protein